MTREEYLTYRNANSIDPIYHYYSDRCKKDCLDIHRFVQYFQIWPGFHEVYGRLLHMYDERFEVIRVQDLKTGQILKYL